MTRAGRCVGCQEAPGTQRVPDLGAVCESCAEVLDVVFEVEIERVEEATKKVRETLRTWSTL